MTSTKEALESLMEELNATITDSFKPKNPFERGDEKIGIIHDEYTRKLYSLAMMHRRDEKLADTELQYSDVEEDQSSTLLQSSMETEAIADALLELFWVSVRRELNFWVRASIGRLKGWVLVKIKPSAVDALRQFLQGGE